VLKAPQSPHVAVLSGIGRSILPAHDRRAPMAKRSCRVSVSHPRAAAHCQRSARATISDSWRPGITARRGDLGLHHVARKVGDSLAELAQVIRSS
jgi:hypothetical protein